ncbi:hypothetical protein HDU84_005963 [Entophlyctis sp. JEL0112]|nr:hypothetical protein HDU84_005963 [Entophlyctis sp. JEL0112]
MSNISTDPVVRTVIGVALGLTVIGCGEPEGLSPVDRSASRTQTQIEEHMRRNNSLYNLPEYAEPAPSYKNSATPAPQYADE